MNIPIDLSTVSSDDPSRFSDVGFCVSGSVDSKITSLLEGSGAKFRTYAGVSTTHFIAGRDADEMKVEEAKDIFEVSVVVPEWAAMSLKLGKILPVDGFERHHKQLFASVVVTTSGVNGKDLETLWTIITFHGGKVMKPLTKKCTHLITNGCTGNKYQIAKENGLKIVTSDWVPDSANAGQLLDESRYDPQLIVLPQTPVVQNSGQQVVPQNSGQQVLTQNSGQRLATQNSGQKVIVTQTSAKPVVTQNSGEKTVPQTLGQPAVAPNSGQQTVQKTSGQQAAPPTSGQQVTPQMTAHQNVTKNSGQQVVTQSSVQQVVVQTSGQQGTLQSPAQQILMQNSGQQIVMQSQSGQQVVMQNPGQQTMIPNSGQVVLQNQGGQQVVMQNQVAHQHLQSQGQQILHNQLPQPVMQNQNSQMIQAQLSQQQIPNQGSQQIMQSQLPQGSQQIMQNQLPQGPQIMQGQLPQGSQIMQGQLPQGSQQIMQSQLPQGSQQIMQNQLHQGPQQIMQSQLSQGPQQLLQNQQSHQLPNQPPQHQFPQQQQQIQGQLQYQTQNVQQMQFQAQSPIKVQSQQQQIQGQIPYQTQNMQQMQFQAQSPIKVQFQQQQIQGQMQYQTQNVPQMQFQAQSPMKVQSPQQFNQIQQQHMVPNTQQHQQQVRLSLQSPQPQNQQVHFQVVQQQQSGNRPQMMMGQMQNRGQFQQMQQSSNPQSSTALPMNQTLFRQQQPQGQIQLFHPIQQQQQRMPSPPSNQQQQQGGQQGQQPQSQLQQTLINQSQIQPTQLQQGSQQHYNVVINQQFPQGSSPIQTHPHQGSQSLQHPQQGMQQTVQFQPRAGTQWTQQQQGMPPQQGMAPQQGMPQQAGQFQPRPSTQWTQQQQMEIIRQIQQDPQIKQQWTRMDSQQRALLIQKLAQRNREELLRREMMLRQQHMSQQPGAGPPTQGSPNQQQQQGQIPVGQGLPSNQVIQGQQQDKPLSQNMHQSHSPIGQGSNLSPTQPSLQSPQGPMGSQQQQQIIIQNLQDAKNQPGMHPNQVLLQSHQHQSLPHNQQKAITPQLSPGNQQKFLAPAPVQTRLGQNIHQSHSPIGQGPNVSPTQPPQSPQGPMGIQNHQDAQKNQVGMHPNQILMQSHQHQQLPHNQQKVINPQLSPGNQQKFLAPAPVQTRPTHGVIGAPQQTPQGAGVVRTQQIFTPQVGQQQQRVNIRHVLIHPGQNRPQVVLQQQQQNQQLPNQKMPIIQQHNQVPQPSNQWSPSQQRVVTPGSPNQFPTRLPATEQQNGSQPLWNVRPQSSQSPQSPGGGNPASMSYVQVVNSKTKTALANLLSTRLQGNAGPESNVASATLTSTTSTPQAMCPPPPPPVTSQSLPHSAPTTTQSNVLFQRRTLTNLTNGCKTIQVNSFGSSARAATSQASPTLAVSPSRPQFYGHDTQTKLPVDGWFIGCVFWASHEITLHHWERVVTQHGGVVVEEYAQQFVTHVLCATQKFPEFQQVLRDGKRIVTLHWLNDVQERKMMVPPFYAIHLPTPFTEGEKPMQNHVLCVGGFSDKDRNRVKTMCKLVGAKCISYFTQLNTGLVTCRAEGIKYQKAREWKIPVISVQFLNEVLMGHLSCMQMIHSPKYQNFNVDQPFRFDIALAPHLMAAWKIPVRVNPEAIEKFKTSKRSPEGELENDSKRIKLEPCEMEFDHELLSPIPDLSEVKVEPDEPFEFSVPGWPDEKTPVVMVSGFTREFKIKMQHKIEKLGGKNTSDFNQATHLILKEDFVTTKLFLGLCRLDYIVSSKWLYISLRDGKFVDPRKYMLRHAPFEQQYQQTIMDVLMKPARHGLFKGVTFFMTPGNWLLKRDVELVIEAAGGSIDRKQKSLKHIRDYCSRFPKRSVIITSEADFELMEDYFLDAKRPHLINIYTDSFIWYCIAAQRLKLRQTSL